MWVYKEHMLDREHMLEAFRGFSTQFLNAWITASDQVKDLFSDPTYQAFSKMTDFFLDSPSLFNLETHADKIRHSIEFQAARTIAMRAIYKEIGILPSETRWLRFKLAGTHFLRH
jgi:hypothetical protein